MLAQILHPNPDKRPKDLVVLGEMIRSCLLKTERRLALADRYGIPFRTTIPRMTQPRPRRLLRTALAFGVLVVAAMVLAPILLPGPTGKILHRARETKSIGVLVGVPESSPAPAAVQNAATPMAPATVLSQAANVAIGVRESTSDGHCGSSQFVSSCIPGSSTEPGIERTTAGRGNAGRFRGHFPGRGSGNLNCERGCYGIPERLRGCTTVHYRSVEFAQQKETRHFDIVASPGFDARPNARNYVRRKDNLPFALGPHEDCRARLGRKSIRSAQASPRSNPER